MSNAKLIMPLPGIPAAPTASNVWDPSNSMEIVPTVPTTVFRSPGVSNTSICVERIQSLPFRAQRFISNFEYYNGIYQNTPGLTRAHIVVAIEERGAAHFVGAEDSPLDFNDALNKFHNFWVEK